MSRQDDINVNGGEKTAIAEERIVEQDCQSEDEPAAPPPINSNHDDDYDYNNSATNYSRDTPTIVHKYGQHSSTPTPPHSAAGKI